ncbi:hypothetical protein RFI36_09505 [Acinetobacter gerneri]|jgi:hypothetical protein|uniref:Uncharacterized protein n=1 Tax=Acinetobacter gerneri TaxID=202952 RepID=A0AAW8JH41_9GAMM|nr:hypothetical protein [Acinetobacter gerneri]MCH4243848.1 hypothetical protein [Acinetobacter gerneri]MDQ9010081.1 hypothetical protein [Acinetobacter gerneri]MDQ9013997.1 hypothetical protein [Acinetobacter gerneri]MDQ9025277.1 hypothetical protein [Acinetobacter gerneri]MDQ9052556.1 hypothetical protein [Acinetobacter gerneri]
MKAMIVTFGLFFSIFGIGYLSHQDSEQQKRAEMDKIFQEAQASNTDDSDSNYPYGADLYKANKNI